MHKVQLLTPADTRPAEEAKVWFTDGLRLIRSAPLLWAGVSAAGLGISFAALFVAGILGAVLPLLSLLPMIAAQLFIQAGMLLLCARLAAGEAAQIGDFFAVLPRLKSRGFVQLCLFVLSLDLALTLFQHFLFPEPLLWIENEELHMAEAGRLYQAAAFMVCAQVLILFMTWAVLPLLVEFPASSFAALLCLQFDGMARNLMPLLLFSLLCAAAIAAAFFAAVLLGNLSGALGFIVLIALVIWGWPLLSAWTFSAVRHIFTDW